ncbi:MAG: hypothetical protein WBB82_05130 [Limnothrix sp.]
MLKERLTPCTTLLYHWIQGHNNSEDTALNLNHFQVWTGEFFEEPVTPKEVDRAFVRLMQLQLIRLEGGRVKVLKADEQRSVRLLPLPEKLWKIWKLEHRLALGGVAIASFVFVIASGFAFVNHQHSQSSNQEASSLIKIETPRDL